MKKESSSYPKTISYHATVTIDNMQDLRGFLEHRTSGRFEVEGVKLPWYTSRFTDLAWRLATPVVFETEVRFADSADSHRSITASLRRSMASVLKRNRATASEERR